MVSSDRLRGTEACTVTVLMAAYNAAKTIEAAIRSIMEQTYADWRLLVIDDGSADATADIAEALAKEDERVIVVRSEHLGLCSINNMGLQMIRSKYVARLDSDDVAYPTRLQKQVEFLEAHPEVKVLGSLGHRISASGRILTRIGEGPATVGDYREHLRRRKVFFILNSTVVADRQALIQYGGYRWDDYPADDTALYTRIAQHHPVLTLQEELVGYRITPGGITSRNGWRMVMQFKKFDYNLERDADIDFGGFENFMRRHPWKKLRAWWGFLHKSILRHGAYHWWHQRRVAGAAYLLLGSLLLPHEALRRASRWY